jgi:AhpD family alkylhydroperoxidase
MIVKKSRAASGESHADGDTLINGCRYCGYAHARMAMNAGVSEAELYDLLIGDLCHIPEHELVAVLFAPHYDEHSDRYGAAAWRLQDTYDLEAVNAILAHIRMIIFSMRVWFRPIGIEESPAASAWANIRRDLAIDSYLE